MLQSVFIDAASTSLLTVPPHIEAATRDDGAKVVRAIAAKSIRKAGFYGAAAEKTQYIRTPKRTRHGRVRKLKNYLLFVFSFKQRVATIEKHCFLYVRIL